MRVPPGVQPLRYKWLWLGAGVGCLVVILLLAITPLSARVPSLGGDKVAHFLAFAFLTVWFLGVFEAGLTARVLVALAGYGLLIEFVQSFTPYRSADLYDVMADLVGIGAGWLLASAGLRRWCGRVEALLGAGPP